MSETGRDFPEDNPAALPETADIETSSADYARRFAGRTGQWMLGVQEQITLGFLADLPGATILDVGGGHGQLTIPLAKKGHPVTVLGSDMTCRAPLAAALNDGAYAFRVGNVIDLPFDDNAFDVVICFRLLTHCEQWPRLVAELCRVARQRVIVDYPTSQSLNCIAPMLFKAKKRLEGNTRSWTLFRHEEVYAAFGEAGFEMTGEQAQFFLPMVFHRMAKCQPLSAALEKTCRAIGLTRLWGSPAILECRPREVETG